MISDADAVRTGLFEEWRKDDLLSPDSLKRIRLWNKPFYSVSTKQPGSDSLVVRSIFFVMFFGSPSEPHCRNSMGRFIPPRLQFIQICMHHFTRHVLSLSGYMTGNFSHVSSLHSPRISSEYLRDKLFTARLCRCTARSKYVI